MASVFARGDSMQQCCCVSLYGRLWAAFEAVENGETCQGALQGNTGNTPFLSISDGKIKKKKFYPQRWISLTCAFVHTHSVYTDV